jgi:hypothetical protein
MALLFPFREICTHNKNFEKFPLILREIGLRDFANPVVKRLVSQSPKPENSQHLTFSLLYFGFLLIAISGVAMSSNSSPRFPKPDLPKLRCARKVDFSTTLHSIGTSDFAISRILMQRFRDFTPRNPEMVNGN